MYSASTAFNDLLFNSLFAFIGLFLIAFCMMAAKQKQQEAKVNVNAEFMITMTWPNSCPDDVDLYVEDPNGKVVFFRAREDGLMHLDRDDLGVSNDVIRLEDGTSITYNENVEIVTIRGIIPGEYTVNAHLFAKNSVSETTPVSIKLEKINPQVKLVDNKSINLTQNGDEKTFFRFTLDKEGNVSDLNNDPKPIATLKNPRGDNYSDPYSPNGAPESSPEETPMNPEGEN